MAKWKFTGVEDYTKIYKNEEGDIKCVYPTKVPEWAQDIAAWIYNDAAKGFPTALGIKDIVKGRWAARIAHKAKKK